MLLLKDTHKNSIIIIIKTHDHVSAAKKDMEHTSVLFTGTAKLLFSTLVSLQQIYVFYAFYILIIPVVCDICVPKNYPIFFTFSFFFTLFQKTNFEPTKDNLLMN